MIFGIGWPKTGISTLGKCFEILGYRDFGGELEFTRDVQKGNLAAVFELIRNHETCWSWPWPLIFKECDAAFPGSKFILTIRNVERWLRSWNDMLAAHPPFTDSLWELSRIQWGLPFPNVTNLQLVSRYMQHNRSVGEYFAGERRKRLLVIDWEKGHGWPELCAFLERPVPPVVFPHENRGKHRQELNAADSYI